MKFYLLLFLILTITLVEAQLPQLENGNNDLPSLDDAVTSNNTFNVNFTTTQSITQINTFDQDLNTTNSVQFDNLTLTGNLTLGQKITFAFGEIIDNLVDGWITITGNHNVTGISEADTFFVRNQINFSDDENGTHTLNLEMDSAIFGSAIDESFVFTHPEDHDEGNIMFGVRNTEQWHLLNIKGLNNSANVFDRSLMVYDASSFGLNATKATNCFEMYDTNNWTSRSNCDTDGVGADLLATGIGGFRRGLFVGGSEDGLSSFFRSEGSASFILQGNDADFINGSIHNLIPVTFVSGFLPNDAFTILNVLFEGTISPFVNLDVSPEVWFATSGALCDDGGCVEATGSSGSVDITMTTNVSTQNVNETEINFVYSLVNLIGADNFRLEVNNFNGSGWVQKFTDAGTETTISQRVTLDEGFSNLSSVGFRFVCDVTQALRSCFVDTVKINGTFTANTTASVSGFDSELCFSDGLRGSNGQCNRGIFYNRSLDTIFFNGVINASGTIVGGISGSGTTDNWAKFTASTSIGNAPVSDDGATITMNLPFDGLTINNNLTVDTNVLHVDSDNDGVGIGTTSPSSSDLLQLGDGTATNGMGLRIFSRRPMLRLFEQDTTDENWQIESQAGVLKINTQNDLFNSVSTKLAILQNGNVGVGTASPEVELEIGDVQETSGGVFAGGDPTIGAGGGTRGMLYLEGSTQAEIILDDSAGASNEKMVQLVNEGGTTRFRLLNDAGTIKTENALVIDNTQGNVGIGTSAPGTKLELASADPWDHLNLNRTGVGTMQIFAGNPRSLVFGDGTTGMMNLIQSSGFLGIGTNTPGQLVDVSGALSGSAGSFTNQPTLRITQEVNTAYNISDIHSAIEFFTDDITGNFPAVQAKIAAVSTRANDTAFADAGLEFFYTTSGAVLTSGFILKSNGDFGIGTKSPSEMLHLSTSGDPLIRFDDNTAPRNNTIGQVGADNIIISADGIKQGGNSEIRFFIDAVEQMSVEADGDLVLPNIRASTADRSALCVVIGGGTVTEDIAGNNCDTSSARFKRNIENIGFSGLDMVMQFRPVSYQRIADKRNVTTYYFTAEDMAAIDPNLAYWEVTKQKESFDEIYNYSINELNETIKEVSNITIIENYTVHARYDEPGAVPYSISTKAIDVAHTLAIQELKIENDLLKEDLCTLGIQRWCK